MTEPERVWWYRWLVTHQSEARRILRMDGEDG